MARHKQYRHDDPDPSAGIALVERILKLELPRPVPELQFELLISEYDDYYYAISLPTGDVATLIANLGYEIAYGNEIAELVDGDVATFIAEHKATFQPAPGDGDAVWFDPQSGVNHWALAYARAGWLHVRVVDTG